MRGFHENDDNKSKFGIINMNIFIENEQLEKVNSIYNISAKLFVL